jgi:iron complex outermembrane recepter protein
VRHILLATAAAIAAMTPVAAFAQTAADEASSDEIIVTARKRSESLLDVPIPVSVATAAQLARDQVRAISDLSRLTPALEVSQTSGGENNGGARLRGLGTGAFNASVSPSVAFVVDQAAQGNLAFPFLFDLQQVEVLRGPQGTLFGQGASAGVINVSTVAPTTDRIKISGGLDYAGKGTLGSEVTEVVARGAFNLPLGENAALRIATQWKREKGLQTNTALGVDNVIRDMGFRARLLFKPSDALTVNLIGEYTRTRTNGWNFFAIAIAPNSTDPLGPVTRGIASTGNFKDPTGCRIPTITERAEFYCEDTQALFRNTTTNFSGIVDYELSDAATLTSVTTYRTSERQTYTVNFSRRVFIPAARNENQEDEARQFSQELRVAYKQSGFDLVAGAFYSNFRTETTPIDDSLGYGNGAVGRRTGFSVCANGSPNDASGCIFVPNPFNPLAPPFVDLRPKLAYELTKNNTIAAFADGTVKLGDGVDLFGGLRISRYKNSTATQSRGIATTALRTYAFDETNVSGRIGLRYKPSPTSTIYGSYARGYKPGANVVPTVATDPVTSLKPELSDALEIGAKFDVGRIQLSANAFYTKVANFQIQQSVLQNTALVSVVQNISKVVSKGFEIGAFGKVSDNFSINAGYQFNDVTYPTGFLGDDSTVAVPVVLGGTQFLNAPKHKFTVSADLGIPVGDTLEFYGNTNIVAKSSVLLAQRGDPRYRYPGHTTINLSAGVRDPEGKWRAGLFVRNLTKQREPTAYLASDFAGGSDGGIRAWPVAGLTARVVGFSLDFNY